MTAKGRIVWTLAVSLAWLCSYPCFADEILFQNPKGLQTGTVVGENDQSVTIRFPRDAIKSIIRSGNEGAASPSGRVLWEEGKDYLILKIPRSSIQILRQENAAGTAPMEPGPTSSGLSRTNEQAIRPEGVPEAAGKAGREQISGSSANRDVLRELLHEEMGSVEGTILWQGKPLQNRGVKIVLERYTGFSLAAVRKWFSADKGKTPQDEVVLETRTDSRGHYVFHDVPPGSYRLYWMPDKRTGWIRRLRATPDIDVTTGNLTVENVPEKNQ